MGYGRGGRGGRGGRVQKVMVQPINLIFRFLQNVRYGFFPSTPKALNPRPSTLFDKEEIAQLSSTFRL